jgi:hypothetical protein
MIFMKWVTGLDISSALLREIFNSGKELHKFHMPYAQVYDSIYWEFYALLLFGVFNLIVTLSVTSQFEEAWTLCYTYFHFINDKKSFWTKLGD